MTGHCRDYHGEDMRREEIPNFKHKKIRHRTAALLLTLLIAAAFPFSAMADEASSESSVVAEKTEQLAEGSAAGEESPVSESSAESSAAEISSEESMDSSAETESEVEPGPSAEPSENSQQEASAPLENSQQEASAVLENSGDQSSGDSVKDNAPEASEKASSSSISDETAEKSSQKSETTEKSASAKNTDEKTDKSTKKGNKKSSEESSESSDSSEDEAVEVEEETYVAGYILDNSVLNGKYLFPLDTDNYSAESVTTVTIVTQGYELNVHNGLDIAGSIGDKVYAVEDGTITFCQKWDGKSVEGMQSYGNLLYLTLEDGTIIRYAHLDSFDEKIYSAYLKEGKVTVKAGDVIGYVGSSGNSTGCHLHFEIRDAYGNPKDPKTFITHEPGETTKWNEKKSAAVIKAITYEDNTRKILINASHIL